MPEATDKAKEKAEELNVDPNKVEGSGKDGKVTVEDVEAAADEKAEEVIVKLNPNTGLRGHVFADGSEFVADQRYRKSLGEFEKHQDAKATNGEPILVKE